MTYKRMNEIAEELLRKGKSVVLDACYGKKYQRANVHALAKARNAEFTCVELLCARGRSEKKTYSRMHEEGINVRWKMGNLPRVQIQLREG